MIRNRRGKSMLMMLAVAALSAGLSGPSVAGRHIEAAIVDEGYRRKHQPRQDPRNREQRRADAAEAKRREKAKRKTPAGSAARRIRGK